jgi:hypothetical protein
MPASHDKYRRVFELVPAIGQIMKGKAKALNPKPHAFES